MIGALILAGATVAVGAMLHRWLFWNLGAERRARRAACVALAEIAHQHPEAAPLALAALKVASLPGDPFPEEELRGHG